MSFNIIDLRKPTINHPPCPTCRWAMWLDRIEPDKLDQDKRIFECPRCQHSETVAVR